MARTSTSTPPFPELPSGAEGQRLDMAKHWCREKGATLTPIRRQVLAMLHRHPKGIKAYDLLDAIKLDLPSASPPTVYRALDFLIEQGLAHRIGKKNLFVACSQTAHREPSLFIVCPRCTGVTEFLDNPAVEFLARSLTGAGYLLENPEIEISAVCPDCCQGAGEDGGSH